jgi:hypothetical protein
MKRSYLRREEDEKWRGWSLRISSMKKKKA